MIIERHEATGDLFSAVILKAEVHRMFLDYLADSHDQIRAAGSA